MRAEIRRLHSPDIDWATYTPDDPADVGVLLQVMAGPQGGDGEESFDVMVATPTWLARRLTERPVIPGRHYLFVATFDRAAVEAYLTSAVARATGDTWDDVAGRLARLGHWEYEDYDG